MYMKEQKSDERYLLLAEKWLTGTITPEEEQEYAQWYNNFENEAITIAGSREELRDKLLMNINSKRMPAKQPIRLTLMRAAAAVILITASVTSYFLIFRPLPTKTVATTNKLNTANDDIGPGTSGAILTLGNGQVIVLDTAANGFLAGNAHINKTNLALTFSGEFTKETDYNTLITPRGRQQQLMLSDGTRIWMNAESTVKFPAAFSSGKREIEITGEAYFEVAKDKLRPFVVKIGDAAIEVLGTHFNVMAYPDEEMLKTTLVEGSVKFISGSRSQLLKPGQQSQLFKNKSIKLIENADTEQALAWKNGRQVFVGADIESLIRQIERWYDIDVTFSGEIPPRSFTGDISREANLSEVLQLLEINNIHSTIDIANKKLTLFP